MKTDEQHKRLRIGIEGCRRRRIDPNLSGKEINGAASSSGSKIETAHPPPPPPPRQTLSRVVAGALVSEHDTYIMGLRSRRSELSH